MKEIKQKLPLTIQKANVEDYINTSSGNMKGVEKFISIKKFNSQVKPHGFYKPISKMILINGTE